MFNRLSKFNWRLAGIMLLTTPLHFWRLGEIGLGNLYYAAAVKSMLSDGRLFFFNSFDLGGFVSVDKPPLGLWVQALSAGVLGFNGFSLLMPQALAGVLSVLVLYAMLRKSFGEGTALLAALILALSPINVAADRNNTMDGQLVLVCLLAAWAGLRAAKQGRLGWLLAAAALVGLGFNIKMLQAYTIAPAVFLIYLAAPLRWWKRLLHLGLSGIVLVIISMVWVAAVDLTPADQRPFVGSSQNNTMTELIIGHNGLTRLGPIARVLGLSRPGGNQPGGQPQGQPQSQPGVPPQGQPQGQPGIPPQEQAQSQPGEPPQGQSEIGETGLLRLFNQALAGQASWLLPLALVGILISGLDERLHWRLSERQLQVLMWALWLVPQVVFYSYAGLFHRYYLEMLTPGIAALAAITWSGLWRAWQTGQRRGWLLLPVIAGSAAVQVFILGYFPEQARWLVPAIVGACGLGLVGLVGTRQRHIRWAEVSLSLAVGGLLLAPGAWSGFAALGNPDGALPFAGPELMRGNRPVQQVGMNKKLENYLLTHRAGEKFLVATDRAMDAAPMMLQTGLPVMALGGFSGRDRILSTGQLAERISQREVRFFWLLNEMRTSNTASGWVWLNCARVPPQEYGGMTPPPGSLGGGGPGGLYFLFDCSK